jgi:hypothetical protein
MLKSRQLLFKIFVIAARYVAAQVIKVPKIFHCQKISRILFIIPILCWILWIVWGIFGINDILRTGLYVRFHEFPNIYFSVDLHLISNDSTNGHEFYEQLRDCIRFEAFTGVTMKNVVFWDVALCSSCFNRRFGGTYHLHLQGRRIRERGTSVSRWLQPHPRRRHSS